jgi:D-aminopeptidase
LDFTPPSRSRRRRRPIRSASAWGRLTEFKPFKVQTPVTVDVSFKNYLPAEVLAYLPLFERTDSHSIRYRAKDMVEASAIMNFIGDYRPDLTP